MEELRARLDEIKEDMQQLERVTDLIEREAKIVEFFNSVNKEVI